MPCVRAFGATQFKVGDWVTYPTRPMRSHTQVVGVSGPFGPEPCEYAYRPRRVYDWGEVVEFSLSESVLEASEPPAHRPRSRPESEWGKWTG
ncbi:MAG: hypothetical protein FJ304_08340 [Planctomycetes bacterium]|nr:hypothetical protein [Planctomycetota bacterium]